MAIFQRNVPFLIIISSWTTVSVSIGQISCEFLHVQVVPFVLGAIGTTAWKFRLERVDESNVSVEAEKKQILSEFPFARSNRHG